MRWGSVKTLKAICKVTGIWKLLGDTSLLPGRKDLRAMTLDRVRNPIKTNQKWSHKTRKEKVCIR